VDGQPAALLDGVASVGEVLAFSTGTPYARAMQASGPVLFEVLDGETAERIGRHPAGAGITAGYTAHLAVPLVARGLVLGCAVFSRTAGQPPFGPDDVALASGLAGRAGCASTTPGSTTRNGGITALGDALGTSLAPDGAALGCACLAATGALSLHGEDDITLVLARLSRP
jgi:hypothetical protein